MAKISVLLSRQHDKGEFKMRAIDWHSVQLPQPNRLKTIAPSRGMILFFFCAHKHIRVCKGILDFFSMYFPLFTFTLGMTQTLDHYDFQWLMLSSTKLNWSLIHPPGNTGGYPQESRLGSGKHLSHWFFWWLEQFGSSCFLFLTTEVLFSVK